MNNVTREGKSDGGAQSRIEDPKKRAEDQAQLASEAENRSRRIQNRKAARLKADKARQAQRRARAFKLVGLWCVIIVVGFLSVAWFTPGLIEGLS
jgi:hypothetical protein